MIERTVLRVEGLRKRYGRKLVVQEISFEMQSGEIVGLLGLNGAGKTTTFHMIVGFIKPTQGEIFLGEKEITALPMFKRAREGIVYLPQETSVFTKLTVEENINAVLEYRKDLTKKDRRDKLADLLREFGLTDRRKQKAYTLSGGERRRTEIARALAIEPKFLLLDEPFAGIDPKTVEEIKHVIERLADQNVGILITEHNIYETFDIIHWAHIINKGQIAFAGSPVELANNKDVRDLFLGDKFRMLEKE